MVFGRTGARPVPPLTANMGSPWDTILRTWAQPDNGEHRVMWLRTLGNGKPIVLEAARKTKDLLPQTTGIARRERIRSLERVAMLMKATKYHRTRSVTVDITKHRSRSAHAGR